jgi:hypothetical protein
MRVYSGYKGLLVGEECNLFSTKVQNAKTTSLLLKANTNFN